MSRNDWEGLRLQKIRENFNPLEKDNIDILYHYRTLEGFWNILESEQFWATNARFSNDQKEQSLGLKKYNKEKEKIIKSKIKEKQRLINEYKIKLGILKDKNDSNDVNEISKLEKLISHLEEQISDIEKDRTNDIPDDCYIVCFCKEDDKLSQWRAYADGGVSMGLEVANIRTYDLKKKDKEDYIKYINTCFKVYYVSDEDDLSALSVLKDAQILKEKGLKLIPYIKHKGFIEENEYRLVFYNKNDKENNYINISECVNYRIQNDIKIPYIVVEFKTKPNLKGTIRICGEKSDDMYELIAKTINVNENLNIINCFDEHMAYHNDECDGCILKEYGNAQNRKRYFKKRCGYLNDSAIVKVRENLVNRIENNSIIIPNVSNQESLFNQINPIVQSWNSENSNHKYFIWCDGHLPLRTITVGPCRNQEEIYLSIVHYCKNHYWLNYVIVRKSETPYRKSLV